MQQTFEVRVGSVIGSEHVFRQTNCQDKYRYAKIQLEAKSYLVGVVCDGCSGGPQSEVGAALLAEFIVQEAGRRLKVGCAVEQIPGELYGRALLFLDGLTGLLLGEEAASEAVSGFAGTYLLATIVGFIVGEEKTVVFAAGDGLIILNDELIVRDEGNAPHYLAYGLLDPSQLETSRPPRTNFDTLTLDTTELNHLAVWTDGFDPTLQDQIWQLGGPRSLQRKLNVWAKQKLFADDTTGITVERMKDEE